jgi:hypothetical protein
MAIDVLNEDPYGNPLPTGTGGSADAARYLEAIKQLYRDLLGREPAAGEAEAWTNTADIMAVQDAIKQSPEYQQRQQAGAGGGTGTGGAGTGGGGATTGYDPAKLQAALLAHTGPATAAELASFIAAHPEFATGVTIGGSKKNKLYGPGGQFLADVIQGTSTSSPSWAWDVSTGAADGGGGGVNPDYLQPFTTSFADYWKQVYGTDYSPGANTFAAPEDFKGVDMAALMNDPGYQFRKNEAAGALQNSAAAKGILNDSGTLYALQRQGDAMAGQEYQNVWDRGFGKWNADWAHALGSFDANKSASDGDYAKAWQQYVEAKDTHFRNMDNPFDKLTRAASLGLGAV